MDFKLFDLPTKEIYNDLFSPGTKKAGEALATVLDVANLILLPLKLANKHSRIYFENNIKRYAAKLETKKELTPTQVPQYIGLPVLDKLTYLQENELSEAFINLLTKASFEESQNLTHPAFVSILNNLSTDEAKILYFFKDIERIPFIDIYIHKFIENIKKPAKKEGPKTKEELKHQINYTFQDKQHAYIRFAWNLTGIEKEVTLMFPRNIDLYVENLQRNGLIFFEDKIIYNDDFGRYEELEKSIYKHIYEELARNVEEIKKDTDYKMEIDTRRKSIFFTELGKSFLKACIKE